MSATTKDMGSVCVGEEIAAEVVPEVKKTYLDDGFVFGLEGGLERPKGKKVATIVVENDGVETTLTQFALVTSTLAVYALSFTSLINTLFATNDGDLPQTLAQVMGILIFSWVSADFGSGVLHWSVDNYGNGRTPVMGNIIAAFQGHHSAPWTITDRGFCNNIHKLCYPFGIPSLVLANTLLPAQGALFITFFCLFELLSQEFHKWSHQPRHELPGWVTMLQDNGVIIGQKPHAKHHVAPYEGNYCIVSGFCNDFLDRNGAFRMLEHIVYNMNGVESNAWKIDPKLKEKTLMGRYKLDI